VVSIKTDAKLTCFAAMTVKRKRDLSQKEYIYRGHSDDLVPRLD
jgi:hypothetical protein